MEIDHNPPDRETVLHLAKKLTQTIDDPQVISSVLHATLGDFTSVSKFEIAKLKANQSTPAFSSLDLIEHLAHTQRVFDQSTFRKTKVLGEGAYGQVCLYKNDKNSVAVKEMRSEKDFVKEVNIYSLLELNKAKYMLKMHDFYEENGMREFYLVMDCASGDLFDMINDNAVLDKTLMAGWLLQGLGYLQESGIIHGDIKPENILIRRGKPIFADFGLADYYQSDLIKRSGTMGYIPPEMLKGNSKATFQGDCFSLAKVVGIMCNPNIYHITTERVFTESKHGTFDYHKEQTRKALVNERKAIKKCRLIYPTCIKDKGMVEQFSRMIDEDPKNRCLVSTIKKYPRSPALQLMRYTPELYTWIAELVEMYNYSYKTFINTIDCIERYYVVNNLEIEDIQGIACAAFMCSSFFFEKVHPTHLDMTDVSMGTYIKSIHFFEFLKGVDGMVVLPGFEDWLEDDLTVQSALDELLNDL